MIAFFDCVAFAQGPHDQVVRPVVKLHAGEHRREFLFQNLLANEALGTLSTKAGAMVVDVLRLLDLGCQSAAAVSARDQPSEGKFPDSAPCLGSAGIIAAVEYILDALPEFERNQPLVIAIVKLPAPFELASVKPIPQDLVDRANRYRMPALAVGQTSIARQGGGLLERVMAARVPFEEAFDDWPLLGVDDNDLLPVRLTCVKISEWSCAGPKALFGLFQHALAHFFGQIVDVVLRHQDLDAVHELFRRSGFARQDHTFLDQVDLGLEFIDGHPVFQVAIKPVRFFNEDCLDGSVLAQKTDHLTEACATALFRGFDIDIFACDGEAAHLSVLTQQLELRRDGKALTFLLARGDARVNYGTLHLDNFLLGSGPGLCLS